MPDGLETALRQRLRGDAAVMAIAGPRVDWNERPQEDPLPSVSLLVVYDPRPRHMTGFDAFRGVRVQIDCWAWNGPTKKALRDAVLAVLTVPETVGEVQLGRAQNVSVRDLGESSPKGWRHRDSIDVVIWTNG